jgi:uncharacterized protein
MNPFLITGYRGPEYFCNRVDDTSRIIDAIRNSRNLTLLSERRFGKTTLLRHVENQLDRKIVFIYTDLYPTMQLKDFVQVFSNGILRHLEPFSDKLMRKITGFFGALSPRFSFDPVTGVPNLEFSLSGRTETEKSIALLFEYIRQSEAQVVVAFDEFQQIQSYPEKNVEALLRSEIQKDSLNSFIYSGSQTHLLISMFREYSRPFYQSSELMRLDKISKDQYVPFIVKLFGVGKIKISNSTAEHFYDINRGITYNVQYLCNRLFSLGLTEISKKQADEMIQEILKENEIVYFNYRELLTDLQFKIIKAVAREEIVEKPFSNHFIRKHDLGSASSVKTGIEALVKRGLLVYDQTLRLNDWYFSLWLKNQL